ncbi:MAG TPA: GAF domain-containing protein [Clostridia bacterium]|nr:GAF domain-containing protein [Clostridia bacterium]
MSHEPRSRIIAPRWVPQADTARRTLQTILAFAYGLQVGQTRRLHSELMDLARQARLATMAGGAAIAISNQNQFECIARSGEAAPQLGSRPEGNVGLSGECIRTGIPQLCADTETHPIVDRMHSRDFGVRSIIYVPLLRGMQPAGVIGVFSGESNHFDIRDLKMVKLIAREVTKLLQWERAADSLPTPVVCSEQPAIEASEPANPPDGVAESFPQCSNDDFASMAETSIAISVPVFEVPSFDLTEHRTSSRTLLLVSSALAIIALIALSWRLVPRSISTDSVNVAQSAPSLPEPQVLPSDVTHVTPTNEMVVPGSSEPDSPQTRSPETGSPVPQLAGVPTITAVITQVTPGHTFVSVRLSGPAQFQTHQLSNPDRIYVDLHGVELSPEMKVRGVASAGMVRNFRIGRNAEGVVRLVMELNTPSAYLVSATSNPYLIVFDLQPKPDKAN